MRLEDLGLIGNCQFSALVENTGAIVWCCLPRFDSEPVFSTLLDHAAGGVFVVAPGDGARGRQRYVENTNVLETHFQADGGTFRVLDFAPRFLLYERAFRPTQLVRIVEPLEGTPRIQVRCEPRLGWSKAAPVELQGSNHVRFEGFPSQLRLTTDIPLAYLGGRAFALTERRHLVLTWGAPVEEPLQPLCDRFLGETIRYWQRWVKHCNIPPLYQRQVIRSALVLKLHCFEGTGAIVAAMTTFDSRSPRQRAHVGLPLLLAARCLLRARGISAAGPLRGAGGVRSLSSQPRLGDAGAGAGPALSHRRHVQPRREDPARLAGLWW